MRFLRSASIAILATACGDDARPALERLQVSVVDEDETTPLAGALVLFDPPGGGARIARTTRADGTVDFEADFASGGANVTVDSPDHVIFTALDVTPVAPVVLSPARLTRVAREASISLRGVISGTDPRGTRVDVAASGVRLGAYEGPSGTYALRAPRGVPFFLLGHETKNVTSDGARVVNEHVRSFRVDVTARDADGTLDLDLAAIPTLAVRSVPLRAELPAAPFEAGTKASATVLSGTSDVLVAPVERSAPSADGRAFDLAMSVPAVDIAPERAFTRVVLVAPNGARSLRTEPGVVADGAVIGDFALPPPVPQGTRSIARPIAIEGAAPDAEVSVEVIANGQIGWILRAPQKRLASVTLPVPPGRPLPPLVAVRIVTRADRLDRDIYRRVAISADLLLFR